MQWFPNNIHYFKGYSSVKRLRKIGEEEVHSKSKFDEIKAVKDLYAPTKIVVYFHNTNDIRVSLVTEIRLENALLEIKNSTKTPFKNLIS